MLVDGEIGFQEYLFNQFWAFILVAFKFDEVVVSLLAASLTRDKVLDHFHKRVQNEVDIFRKRILVLIKLDLVVVKLCQSLYELKSLLK